MIFRWDAAPEIFQLGPLTVRWYGALFAFGFFLAFVFVRRAYLREKKPLPHLDELLMHTIVGCVVGARLGHCLFYEPARYLANPLEILFIWHGGLASHGATIGMFLSTWWFSRKPERESFWWAIDRIAMVVPLSGACVRLGNFFNSEILGKPTDGSWGVIFSRVDQVPRHPAMLYEAAAYLVFFAILHGLYRKWGAKTPRGFFFGLCITMIFVARFFIEFVKENQVDFESTLPLNMGQLLSLPVIVVGIWLMRSSVTRR